MHSLKLRAAMAATLIAIAAVSPAAAQFFDTPPPVQKKTKKAKQAAPKQQPAAPATTAPPTAPSAQPAAIAPPAKPGQRAPYPPPNENCRNTESFPAWLARFKKDAAAAGIRPQHHQCRARRHEHRQQGHRARPRPEVLLADLPRLPGQARHAEPRHLRTQEDRPAQGHLRACAAASSACRPPSSPASGRWRATSAPAWATSRSCPRSSRSPTTAAGR